MATKPRYRIVWDFRTSYSHHIIGIGYDCFGDDCILCQRSFYIHGGGYIDLVKDVR
jgi:hypothetical protein